MTLIDPYGPFKIFQYGFLFRVESLSEFYSLQTTKELSKNRHFIVSQMETK